VKVLVTGSSGFIGTNFCEKFHNSRRYDIVAVDCRPPREEFPGVVYETADLRDREAIRRVVQASEPAIVVHLAAQARVEPSLVNPGETYQRNVAGTVNLLEATLDGRKDLECFVYASSETVYGPATEYPTPETSALHPQSAYAASKAACELLVRNVNGLPYLILRSAMGYGPRSNPREQVVAKFLAKALRDEPILFPQDVPKHLHPTRDINYVQNYLEAMDRALVAGAEGIFNVGSGQETSILDLASEIVELVGSGSITFDSHFQYRSGELGLRTWLDTGRASEAFGYRPRITRRDGLVGTLDWLSRNPDYWSRAETALGVASTAVGRAA